MTTLQGETTLTSQASATPKQVSISANACPGDPPGPPETETQHQSVGSSGREDTDIPQQNHRKISTGSWRADQVGRPPSSEGSRARSVGSKSVYAPGVRGHVHRSLRKFFRPWLDSKAFKGTIMFCLLFALFGGSLWQLCDVPDKPGNDVLDAFMIAVLFVFLLELVLTSIVDFRDYPLSLFFWMDVLGSASMLFEISFIFGYGGKMRESESSDTNMMLMRAARATKMGARAGRLSKIVKCLSVAFGNENRQLKDAGKQNAKVISRRLMLTLSTKVSLLTVTLVLVVPLFQLGRYPVNDFSLLAWSLRLESDYKRAYYAVKSGVANTDIFEESIVGLKEFFGGLEYRPFQLSGFNSTAQVLEGQHLTIPGAPGTSLLDKFPNRLENVMRQTVPSCDLPRIGCSSDTKASVLYDFTGPGQMAATLDMLMIVFIVIVMVFCSFNLNATLDRMMVQPLERMLGMVRNMTTNILSTVSKISTVQSDMPDEDDGDEEDSGDEEEQAAAAMNEIELLEQVFLKLNNISNLFMQRNVVEDDEMADLDNEQRGVIEDIMQLGGRSHQPSTHRRSDMVNQDDAVAQEAIVKELPVEAEVIDSWDLDLLDLQADDQGKIMLYIFFDSSMGRITGRQFIDLETFWRFHEEVKKGYSEMPYHNYAHACDVTHNVYRSLVLTQAQGWIRESEVYALLVAALCHDVGHRGVTNPFLVETKHELALRYNDKSPLENMHAARLFEICVKEETNVFKALGSEEYKQCRKVCVSTILHTDNANHFDMVKDINTFYEVTSEICDAQARSPDQQLPDYSSAVLCKDTLLWMEVFLHLADVSNPLKPFKICQAWAWRVLDEFFAQGDEELRLGIPVGMLNDRSKVNKPGSQHGFINFLVAPLVIGVVKIFPPMHHLLTQMVVNLQSWRDVWIEEASPKDDDIAKRNADIQKIKGSADELENKQSGKTGLGSERDRSHRG